MVDLDAADDLSAEQRAALERHGFDSHAWPCGTQYSPVTSTYRNINGELLRSHVCELEGIEIEGHETSEWDPGSSSCIHCDYEGPNP